MTLTADERANADIMFAAMDGILVDHDPASVERHFHPDFIQHNPWAADGAEHVKEMCAFTFGLISARWVAQGDLVAYHGYYTAPNPLGDTPLVCVDLWRVRGGRIVEHWDALMPVADTAAAEEAIRGGGDGGADVDDATVEANAAAVRHALEAEKDREIEVRRTIASGDLVIAHCLVSGAEPHVSWEIVRRDRGESVESWSVRQPIAPAEQQANAHPHF